MNSERDPRHLNIFHECLLAVGDDGHRRSENVKQFAVRDVDEKDETWHHMSVPEKIGIDLYVFKEQGQEVTAKRSPVIGACRGEVSHVDMCLNDLMVRDSIALHEKTRKFQEEDEEQGGDIFFFRAKLVRAENKAAHDSHHATDKDQKTEELKEEIEKWADCSYLKLVRKGKRGKFFTQFNQVTGRKSLNHVHNKSSYESEYQKGVSEPSVK